MQLEQIALGAVEHLIGRLLRRLLVAIAVGVFALIALYHFESSGLLALQVQYGAVDAHLIVGGIFVAAALMGLFALWRMMRKSRKAVDTAMLPNAREMQLAMLVEAVMLGYALAQRSDRAR